MKTKKCCSCNKRKTVSSFSKASKTKDGLQSSCKACKKIYSQQWFQKNKSKVLENRKPYKRSYAKTPRGRYHKYTESAKKRAIDFDLSFAEFELIITLPCKYCGDFSDDLNISGVDRIDSNKGYTVENSVPCCTFCNQAKSDYEFDYFINKIKKIFARL